MTTYTVDGIPLDHPSGCWRLTRDTQRRPIPGARTVTVTVPGRSGELSILGLDLETPTLSLGLAVTDLDAAGASGGYAQMERSLEALTALFGARDSLLDVRYEIDEANVRQADATVVAAAEPDVHIPAAHALFTVVLRVPGVYWRDVDTADWSGAANAASQEVTTLAGGSGPVTDAVVRWTGPVTNPTITDVTSGNVLAYSGTISAGQRLLLDTDTLVATRVTTDTWDPAGGTDVTGNVNPTGPGSAWRWLSLAPAIQTGDVFDRRVIVTTTASGTTGASKVEIRARRAYL